MSAAFSVNRTEGYTATTSPAFSAWPAGEPTAGHLALLLLTSPNTAPVLSTPPSGWTSLFNASASADGDATGWLYFRVLTGSDSLPSWTWSVAQDSTAEMVIITGQAAGTTSAELFTNTAAGSAAAGLSQTTPAVTAAAGDLALSLIAVDAAAAVARPYYSVASATKRVDDEGTNNVEVGVADSLPAAGSVSHTWTLATSESPVMFTLAVIAASSVAAPSLFVVQSPVRLA